MKRCSNNQAEQLAIVKALEVVESLNIDDSSQRTAAVITDSRVALDSIKNAQNHSFLIEEIRHAFEARAIQLDHVVLVG
jgi:ribonuclease HI